MDDNRKKIFFRNDDIRDSLDSSLIELTRLFISHKVPVAHAVEPANVSSEVVNWLLQKKTEHPDLIEIIQHGFDHNIGNRGIKMEFGGNRGFEDQLIDVKKGVELMNTYFGDLWTPVFTFPYGTYNRDSLKAISACGYKVLSSKIKFSASARLKNIAGKAMGIDEFCGKHIQYHPGLRKEYGFREISVSANLIKSYTAYNTAIHFSLEELTDQILLAGKHTNIIGILLHHRFHTKEMLLIEELIKFLKQSGFSFSTFKELITKN